MPSITSRAIAAAFLGVMFLPALAIDIPLTADAHISSSTPTLNSGALPTLNVGPGSVALLNFNLSTLPAATTAARVTKATLKLFVNRVATPGQMDVLTILSAWQEGSVTFATQPFIIPNSGQGAYGGTFTIGAKDAQQYIAIDVTDQVKAWIAHPRSNIGLAIASSAMTSTSAAFFDSKENTATGHPASLDISVSSSGAGIECTGPGRLLQSAGGEFLCVNSSPTVKRSSVADVVSSFGCAGAGWQGLTVVSVLDFYANRTVTLSASNLEADYSWAGRGFSTTQINYFPVVISFANGRDNMQLQVTAAGELWGACKTGGPWYLMLTNLL